MKAKILRFLFGTIALAIFLVGPIVSVTACGAHKPSPKTLERTGSYGAALAICEAKSPSGPSGWNDYVPCCFAAADAFKRPRGDCADGGVQ